MVNQTFDLGDRWWQVFLAGVRTYENAGPLKGAALAGRAKDWTGLLTGVVVRSCRELGWQAAAKGFALDLLPQAGQEYLGMDVMAFATAGPDAARGWRFPVAVFELENSRNDDRVAYSLWKVLCMRCRLRVVFAYRRDWEEARQLVARLATEVIGPIGFPEREALAGQTLLVVGSRGEDDTFPWGYFKVWALAANLGSFEKV
jgi:hypothetical protein